MKAIIIIGDIEEKGNIFDRVKEIYLRYNNGKDIEVCTNNPQIVDMINNLYKNVEVYIQEKDERRFMECSTYVFDYFATIYEVVSTINICHSFDEDSVDEINNIIEEHRKGWR